MRPVSRTVLALVMLATLALQAACGRLGYEQLYGQILVVTITADRMAGPATMDSPTDVSAAGLSLREALTIAHNHDGTDLIYFDPSVWPPGDPVVFTPTEPLPGVDTEGTEISGHDGGVIIDGSGTTDPVITVTADGCSVGGITIINAGGDAVVVDGATGVRVSEMTILDPVGRGIVVTNSSDIMIEGNRIERPGSDLITVVDSTNIDIRWNFGIIGDKGANRGVRFTRVDDSRICDNIIDPGSARLIDLDDSSRNEICRNVLDRGHAGVVLEGESHENFVFQNAIIGSEYDGVYVSSASTGNTVVHNTMLDCHTALVDGASDTVKGNNLVSTDLTEFVDPMPPAYDFRLVEGSPHIDAGEELGYDCLPESDELFLGAAPDLGAVESY